MDVPFCCRCSRFMVIEVGKALVVLDHIETAGMVIVREGEVFKCPKCACMTIYKWTSRFKVDNKKLKEKYKNWIIYLESHEHLNWRRGKK